MSTTLPPLALLSAVLVLGSAGCATTRRAVPPPDHLPASPDRPAFSALSPDQRQHLARWMSQDCRVGSEDLEARLAAAGPALEKALWEAYDRGPTLRGREELQASLGERWRLRRRWLEEHGREAIGPERTSELLAESEEQFRLGEDVKQVHRWRDAAVGGLAIVCTEGSRQRLQALAEDPRASASIAARAALKASANCSIRRAR